MRSNHHFYRTHAVAVLLIAFAVIAGNLPAGAARLYRPDPADIPAMPDPLHVADSAVGIAPVQCTFRDTILPTRFRVERLLAGTLPDSFSVRGPGYYLRGERCAQILTRRPHCMDSIPGRYRKYIQDFDTIHVPGVTGEFGWSGALWPDSERVIQVAEDLWRASELPVDELRRRIMVWLSPRDLSTQTSPGTEALMRYPELRDTAIEDILLERCRSNRPWWDRDRSARTLGVRPDSLIRATARELWTEDFNNRRVAVSLIASDTLPETRSWLINVALRDSISLVAEAAIEALQPNAPAERLALIDLVAETEATVRAIADTLRPDRDVPEYLGERMSDLNSVRQAALGRLGSDTSSTVRGAIARIIREPVYWWGGTGPDIDVGEVSLDASDLTHIWTRTELAGALSDPSQRIRFLAYRETGRRKDLAAAQGILEHLRENQLPIGTALDLEETERMIRALGEVGDTTAVPELIRRADLPHAFEGRCCGPATSLRFAAYEALANFDDPRAIQALRNLAAFTATDTSWIAWKWMLIWPVIKALSFHGDSTDVAFYRRLARLNPNMFREAAQGVASVGGPQALFELLDSVKGPDPTAPSGLFITPWVTGSCGRSTD